jgi:dipeptidyl aminopeptidase/acylaminoacyl peptidase
MTTKKQAPYGSWASPITADWITAGTVGLGQIVLDGGDLYWNEVRPSEKGRSVVCRIGADGIVEEVSAADANLRTRVHEYGGGAYTVAKGTLWYSDDTDGRIHRQDPGAAPAAVSPQGPWRYADLLRDAARRRIIAVREDHSGDGEPANALVALGDDGAVVVLAEGADFYAAPRLSPDGETLAWLSWSHPNMPWDGCTLWRAGLDDAGLPAEPEAVAGGLEEAVFQPEFSPDGELFFVSDRSGWWNLYRCDGGGIAPVLLLEADFGLPQWVFGMATYGFASAREIVTAYVVDGLWKLAVIDLASGVLEPVICPFLDVHGVRAGNRQAVFIGGAPFEPPMIVALDLATRSLSLRYKSAESGLEPGYVSRAEALCFPVGSGETAHAFYYPPCNAAFDAPDGELPPLIVKSHGGPTGQTTAAFNVKIQYWTSRGFAVLDVNYRGSTGFGRDYRRRLDSEWGVIDVEDCVAGARFVAERGLVDPKRMAISGGSAGGYTTLCALAFHDCFAAGASHYGIGDLSALAADTHKFESRYLDRLVGPWPEAEARYRERSPLLHTKGLDCPVIFLQGLEDKVVPPNQAEAMVAALREKGVPVAYIAFPEEAHGFRQAANVKRALEAELAFYGRIFGFAPADDIAPVEIENL